MTLPPLAALIAAAPVPAPWAGGAYSIKRHGATLGSLVISRHARRTLGLTPGFGARIFQSNFARTADMWRAFRPALAGFAASPTTADAVV